MNSNRLMIGMAALTMSVAGWACEPNSVVPFEPNTICVLYFENGAIVMRPVITVDAPHRWTVTGPHKFYTYPALYEFFKADPNTYGPEDFATLAEYWQKPPESTLGVICYTLGGKDHLYRHCSSIVGKVVTECDCKPNNENICLKCLARKIRESTDFTD